MSERAAGGFDREALERRLGATFEEPELLERALTHKSFAHEAKDARPAHNESLEFLGDAVLGFLVTDLIFRRFPQMNEGKQSKIKAHLVSTVTLSRLSGQLGLPDHLRLGRGEEKTGGRRKMALRANALEAVVAAVPETPVTLKFRTGWDSQNRNAPAIARIAEQSGIRAVAVHGRTRADQYTGHAEYDTIALVKAQVRIPVIANGDIDSPEKARFVLDHTGADGLMIGRAAQGRPWLFREIEHYLATGRHLPPPRVAEIHAILRDHLADLYDFYGEETGVKIARKHIGWYTKGLAGAAHFRHAMNQLPTRDAQMAATDEFFLAQAAANDHLIYEREAA